MMNIKLLAVSLFVALNSFVSVSTQAAQVITKPVYEENYVPILMYHNVVPEGKVTNWSAQVSAPNFYKQLKTLLDNGYQAITFEDYDKYLKGQGSLPAKPFIVTFDDGYLDNYTVAYPIMYALGVKSTMFVSTKYVGVTTTAGPHFTWEQAKDMEDDGLVSIQSHTHTHANMSLESTDYYYQISESFSLIEENLGERDIKVLAYPQFKNCWASRKTAVDFGVSFQISNLATEKNTDVLFKNELHRIHTHNNMTGQQLLDEIEMLTMN